MACIYCTRGTIIEAASGCHVPADGGNGDASTFWNTAVDMGILRLAAISAVLRFCMAGSMLLAFWLGTISFPTDMQRKLTDEANGMMLVWSQVVANAGSLARVGTSMFSVPMMTCIPDPCSAYRTSCCGSKIRIL